MNRIALLGAWLALVAPVSASAQTPPAEIPTPPAPPTAAEVLTLDEAIAFALANQPDIATAAAQTETAAGLLRSTRAERLPSVQVSASTERIQNQPRAFQGARTGVSASQLLYDVGRAGNNIGAARARLEAARAGQEDARLFVARNVTDTYYTLLLNQGVERATAESVLNREAQRGAAVARFEAGTSARFDVLRAEADLARGRQDLAAARGDVRRAEAELNTAIGRPADAPVAVTEPATPAVTDTANAVALAFQERPDVRAARLDVESARRALGAARLGNAPTVFATGGLSDVSRTFPATDLEWAVGVNVTWDAFDSGRNAGRVQAARGDLARAEADLRRTELNVTREVTNAITNVETAAEQARLGEAAVREATEARDVAAGRYTAGVGTQLEVTQAQSDLLAAQVALLNARFGLAAAQRALQYSLGRLPAAPGA